ncbi:MAG: 3-hydroxyacyl-CoA dehydrogenase family protein, partial [Bacteroidota bacterium]
GPLALADELGLDLVLRYEQQAADHYGDKYQQHPAVPALKKMLIDLGRGGKQKRAGFYAYESNGPALLWEGIAEHFPVTKHDYDRRRMKHRFLFSQIIESGWCLQEKIITEAAGANLMSVYGWGFPAYTGGVLRYVESIGSAQFLAWCKELEERYGQRFSVPKYLR